MFKEPKKRNRLSLSCNYCKKRKVKCDRGYPCGSCVKYNVAGLCEYSISSGDKNTIGDLPLFSVRERNLISETVNGRYQDKPILRSIPIAKPNSSNDSSVHTELVMLKDKIKKIEASINVPSSPKPVDIPSTSPQSLESFSSGPHTVNSVINKLPLDHSQPIQLPPLHWFPESPKVSRPLSSEPTSGVGTLSDSETYKPDTNPTFIGINPYESEEETINFYDGYSPIHFKTSSRRMNFGPLAWLSLLHKDRSLRILWDFTKSIKLSDSKMRGKTQIWNQDKSQQQNNESEKNESNTNENPILQGFQQEEFFREKALDRDGYNDLKLYDNTTRDKDVIQNKDDRIKYEKQQNISMNKNAVSLGLTDFDGEIEQELKLIDKIQDILPKQKVIWTLINKFFRYSYPFMPFIDEKYFNEDMSRILGPEDYIDRKIEKLKIEKRLDFANIGMLLIILRFTYLSLFSNKSSVNESNLKTSNESPEAQELKYLFLNPINIDVINMAQICLNQFQVFRKSNLLILQCSVLMRVYHTFAPEDGDGADGGDSQIYNGMLVQMAYSMGINREPDKFKDVCNDERTNNIGRKLWFFLTLVDLNQALIYGNPLCIDDKYADTKSPYFKIGNENIKDIALEKNVISTFAYFGKYYEKMRKILDLILSIKKETRMKEITENISDFENFVDQNYGHLNQFFTPFKDDNFEYPFMKIMKCKSYLNLTNFIMSVFLHFFLHYEKKYNSRLSYFYLRKIFSIMLGELIEGVFQLTGNNHIHFGEGADLILNPSLEMIIHKSIQINFGVMIRLNSTIYRMSCSPDHESKMMDYEYSTEFIKLSKLSKYIQKLIEIFIAALSRLSNRYYYAWRISKAHIYLLKLSLGSDFNEFLIHNEELNFMTLGSTEVDELILICESALTRFTKNKSSNTASEIIKDLQMQDKDLGEGQQETPSYEQELAKINEESQAMARSIISDINKDEKVDKSSSLVPSLSEESTTSLSVEDADFINSAEIDKLWLQMVSLKNDANAKSTNGGPDQNNDSSNQDSDLHLLQTPLGLRLNSPEKGYYESNFFDIFSDNPLDDLFRFNH